MASKHRETGESTTPKKQCFIRYPNTEKWVEKTGRSRVFLTNFRVFDIASRIINNPYRNSFN